jgi:hypothetical protein
MPLDACVLMPLVQETLAYTFNMAKGAGTLQNPVSKNSTFMLFAALVCHSGLLWAVRDVKEVIDENTWYQVPVITNRFT